MSYVRSFSLPRYLVMGSLSVCVGLSYISVSQGEEALTCRPDNLIEPFDPKSANDSFRDGQAAELGRNGFPKDPIKAYQWYCNAALQNDPAAQLKIGLMLLEGQGTKKDLTKGMSWLNRSASQGNHDAELALGILLVDSDAQSSAKLFHRAAAGGNLYANHRLAELYYYGIGVAHSYEKAQELSALGAEAGFEKSKELLTRIRMKQDALAKASSLAEPAVADSAGIIQAPDEDVVIVPPDEPKTTVLQGIMAYLPSLKLSNTQAEAEDVVVAESDAISSTQELIAPIEADSAVSGNGAKLESGANVVLSQESQLADKLVEAANQEIAAIDSATEVQSSDVKLSTLKRPVSRPVTASNNHADVAKTMPKGAGRRSPERRGLEWAKQQPDMGYSIQLVQAGSEEGIRKYIDQYDLHDKSYYIYALQDDQWRYILLYGDYPNNRTSKEVAKTLPQAVQDNGYWIRTYGDLRRSYTIAP